MSQHPGETTARTDAVRGLVLLVTVVVALAALFYDWGADDAAEAHSATTPSPATNTPEPSTASASATPTPEQIRMPDVTGARLDLAEDRLSAFARANGLRASYPRSHDLSPRNRSQWQDENWTVVTTRPAAGQSWDDGTDLHLFVLRNAEWAWFQAHPTMPSVPVDAVVSDLTEPGQLFEEVSELMEYRYAPGQAPEHSSPAYSTPDRPIDGLADDPSVEPQLERQERDALPEAYDRGVLTVGSLPAEGQSLRIGQLITVIVREQPTVSVPGSAGATSATEGEGSAASGSGSTSVGSGSGSGSGTGSGGVDQYTGCRAYGPNGTSVDDQGRRYTKIDCTTKQPIGGG
jgi:hypothetical protein